MTETFTNRKPLFVWGFSLIWLSMLSLMTWALIRDGIPPRSSALAINLTFTFFWIIGLALLRMTFGMPLVRVTAGRFGMSLRERYPHRTVELSYQPRNLERAAVVETRDSDGDPWFNARVVANDGREVNLMESPDRSECQAACERFNMVVFGSR